MSDKPTAHSAERLLLSCAMRAGTGRRAQILDAVRPEMFDQYREAAEVVWSVGEEARPDAHTVRSKMNGEADQVGELEDVSPAPSTWEKHAEDVQQAWGERQYMQLSDDMARSAMKGEDWMDIAAATERRLDEISRALDTADDTDMTDTVQAVMNELEQAQTQGVTGIESGFPGLDDITDGWKDGEVTIIAGRPSMGKTSFALALALNAGIDAGHHVRLHSLEMSRQRLVKRAIAQRARVNVRQPLKDEHWSRITKAAGELSDAPIEADDQPTITAKQIRTRARQQAYQSGLDLLLIDYLQLIQPPSDLSYSNRNKEVGAIARQLKMIAKDLDVPVLALAQLNRGVESRNPPRPQMSDLRDSGEIEEHSDNIIFLYRAEEYGITHDPQGNETEGIGEMIIDKQRNGPSGMVKAAWLAECATWEPLDKRSDDDAPF